MGIIVFGRHYKLRNGSELCWRHAFQYEQNGDVVEREECSGCEHEAACAACAEEPVALAF